MAIVNSKVYHIACAIDDSFSFPLSVMLISILENHKKSRVKIHLFSATLSKKYVLLFEELVTKQYFQEFSFYELNPNIFKNFRINTRISYAAYYRIVMPEIISYEVDRFLYLDADIIITHNLQPLFDLEFGDKVFGAVDDIAAIDWEMHKKHHIPDDYLYFNSGVLLIDRNKWLQIDGTQKVLNYLNDNREICDYHDQDGLNGSLYSYRFKLSPVWNQQVGIYFIKSFLLNKIYGIEYLEAKNNPIIVHFNGNEKPWDFVSEHPWQIQFNKYAIFIKELKPMENTTFRKLIKKYLIYKLLGWKIVNKYFYYKTRPEIPN